MSDIIVYEKLVDEIDYETLPREWQYHLLSYFSDKKKLYDYQINALKNAIKFLWKFYSYYYEYPKKNDYVSFKEAKKKLYNDIRNINKSIENLGLSSKKNKAVNDILEFYDFTTSRGDKIIHFYNFVNRMGFWMATGSGKTLIIVKLVELLDYYIRNNLIPNNDILILTYREDLIEQIKKHIYEYNSYHNRKIDVYDLRDYNKVKYGSVLINKNNINIFIYRSDLISDETKEREISFKDIDNDGRFYIILDEAHKGSKEDSKRQLYYSVLTRFGFLFNFSATFTDPWDIITTVYNFNLDKFIEKGYGKNVYLFQKGINLDEINDDEKEKVILKALILLTACKIAKKEIPNELSYHNPLMVIYGNSVNTDKADLKIAFRVIENIAKKIPIRNFDEAKKDLIEELTKNPKYAFSYDEFYLDRELIENIRPEDILKYVFNSDSPGAIEVITVPNNNEELVFKIKSSDKPFAMIKIGDIKNWLKEEFKGYEINERYENESFFKSINEIDNSINILMGSRSFYEGWDSNRPNVILFINIGVGDSKKYILQSIGRGERIEPVSGKKKRLRYLAMDDPYFKKNYDKVDKKKISLLETLFVFGTSVENLKQILDAIKFETQKSGQAIELNKNEEINGKLLLVPVYTTRDIEDVKDIPKFSGNYDLILKFMDWIGNEKVLYAIFSDYIEPKNIPRLMEYIKKEENFIKVRDGNTLIQIRDLISHINIKLEKFDKFKEIEEEIVHFKHIKVVLDDKKLQELKDKIERVQLLKKLIGDKISAEELQREYNKLITFEEEFWHNNSKLKIKNIEHHYYLPLLISEDEKIEYIDHIIKVKSEREFLEDLENYIKSNKVECDYWFFSKIDDDLDKVYIPYYNRKNNKESKFYPDFIFWIKKGNNYYIVFVDPKGIEHTDYQYKIDGYANIFEEDNEPKVFKYNGMNVKVFLFLYTKNASKIPEKYRKYWIDDVKQIFNVQ